MRGEVLHYDEAQGFGFITGADGNRYTFAREDLRRDFRVSKGTLVEFQAGGGQAREIFAIRAMGQTAPQPAAGLHDPAHTGHFGRYAAQEQPRNTGLWSYFWNGLTANYVNFRARARRKEYWGFYLFWTLAMLACVLVGAAIDGALDNIDSGSPVASVFIPVIFVLATILPCVAIAVRRQHDIGLSGWFYLLILVPYIGGLILFVFSLIPSQKHENKWGPVPAGIPLPLSFTSPSPGTSR